MPLPPPPQYTKPDFIRNRRISLAFLNIVKSRSSAENNSPVDTGMRRDSQGSNKIAQHLNVSPAIDFKLQEYNLERAQRNDGATTPQFEDNLQTSSPDLKLPSQDQLVLNQIYLQHLLTQNSLLMSLPQSALLQQEQVDKAASQIPPQVISSI